MDYKDCIGFVFLLQFYFKLPFGQNMKNDIKNEPQPESLTRIG